MTEPATKFVMEEQGEFPTTPERELWLAVIERALKDYCFFFDKLLNTGNGQVIRYEQLKTAQRNVFNIKAIAEFNRLCWFLFEKASQPFNLQFLCDHLYDDSQGMTDYIRKQATQQFKLHFLQQEKKEQFVAILAFIKETTNVDEVHPASFVSSLKYKRYRNVP